jgi:two-component system response regulator NreC
MAGYRVLIVDDHPIVLSGLRLLMIDDPDFTVCGEAASPAEACLLAEREQPDVIVTDLAMGGEDGSMLVDDLLTIAPTARILIYSSHEETLWAPRVLRAGARGFVSKAEPLDSVGLALRTIVGGRVHLDPAILRRLPSDPTSGGASAPRTLSIRELQVLRLIAEGATLQTLAQTLNLSVKTVGTYRERLKIKLGLENVRMLERFAVDYVAGRTPLP